MSLVDNDNPTILGYLLDLRMDINIWSIHLPKSKIHRRPFVNLAPCAIVFVLAIVLSTGNVFSFPGLDLAPSSAVKRFQYLEGATDVNPTLIPNLRKRGWTVEIVEPGHPQYAGMVQDLTAGWWVGKFHMRLLQKPGENIKQVTVLEEFLHGTQDKIPLFDTKHPYPRYEIHVKDFMIRHRRRLGLEDRDVSVLEELIQMYVQNAKKDTKGIPLSYPPYKRSQ